MLAVQYDFGNDYFEARDGRAAPVRLDTSRLINAHVLLVGSSGVGKSHTIRAMIARGGASAPGVRFHVFDVHGDLDIAGASVAQFSEQAPFGLNPLVVNPDPDFGGVRKAVQAFIRTVNHASITVLGARQESVLRNLLFDVYRDFGFEAERAETWAVNAYDRRLVSGVSDNRLYLVVPIAEKRPGQGARRALGPGEKTLVGAHRRPPRRAHPLGAGVQAARLPHRGRWGGLRASAAPGALSRL